MVNQNFKQKIANSFPLPYYTLVAARPLHWIKNLSLFAAIVFTGTFFIKGYFETVCLAFISFSFATSASYIFNDIIDAPKDRKHPIKKFRPIAANKLSLPYALSEASFLALLSIYIANYLNPLFSTAVIGYILLQIAYSLFLKNIQVVDILIIASGFVIRVYAGAFVINAHLSVWFLLCVISVALFLASGKRRAESNTIHQHESPTRLSLTKYPRELLNSYVTMFGNASWMSWALYTFFESPKADLDLWLVLAEISKATTINKLLMVTIPVVIFGIMRYENLIFEEKSEAPEKVLLSDKPLMISAIVWSATIFFVLYGGLASHGI